MLTERVDSSLSRLRPSPFLGLHRSSRESQPAGRPSASLRPWLTPSLRADVGRTGGLRTRPSPLSRSPSPRAVSPLPLPLLRGILLQNRRLQKDGCRLIMVALVATVPLCPTAARLPPFSRLRGPACRGADSRRCDANPGDGSARLVVRCLLLEAFVLRALVVVPLRNLLRIELELCCQRRPQLHASRSDNMLGVCLEDKPMHLDSRWVSRCAPQATRIDGCGNVAAAR